MPLDPPEKNVLCPDCERPMVPLFFSCVCDYCDGMLDDPELYEGYIVLRDKRLPCEEYVFQSKNDAELWKKVNKLDCHEVARVLAPVEFTWRKSTGSVKGVTTANRLVTIYPNHRFAPEPHRAYLAPVESA